MKVDFGALERDGFCLARDIPEEDVLALLQHLGPIRVDPRNPELARDIRPQATHVAKPNTLSSRYGLGGFPPHTDTAHWEHPARYLVFFCVSPGEGMRPTLLQDSCTWWVDDAEEDLACQALWAVGHRRARLFSLAIRTKNKLVIRYDMDCMRPITADARKLKALLENRIPARPRSRVHWEAGNLLVIDNHRMVHARGEAERPDPSRVLKRILIAEN